MGISSSRPARENTWKCRIPVEIMEMICEHLTKDRALETLASLQSTSSYCYTLVTPFLYRHIVFDTRHAILFINLFNKISRMDRRIFIDFEKVNAGGHLLDQKLAKRLRSFMSHTESLTLITREDMRLHYPKDYKRLKGFFRLQNLLDPIRDRAPLWPNLQRCHIDLSAWPRHSSMLEKRPSSSDKVIMPEISPLVDMLFAKLHPENMSIIIPNRLLDCSTDLCPKTGYAFWWLSIYKLHADHIELAGLSSTGILELFPRASKSLTIRTDRLPTPNPNVQIFETEAYRLGAGVTHRAVHLLQHGNRGALYQIDDLRLIGLIKSDECDDAHPYHWFEERILAGVPATMVGLMRERLKAGNKKDFRLTIMPDTSPESEAEAVWQTFKVPEAV
jgi:hypothetical protein